MAQNIPTTDEVVLLSVKQVAAKLNVSIWTVYTLVENGSLRATRLNRNIRIRPEWVEEYVDGLQPYAPELA
jgi:excisionase family DNA binding protein